LGNALKEGGVLFLSVASTSFYTTGNAFLLGLLAGPVTVAYYSAVEKVMGAAAMLLAPITHAAYPLFSRVASAHTTGRIPFGPRMIIVVGGLGLLVSAGLWTSAPVIVSLLFGPEFEASVLVLRILAGCVVAYALANVFTQQIILPFGHDKAFTAIVLSAAALDIVVALALVPTWGAVGMAVAALAASAFVPVAELVYMSAVGLLPTVRRSAAAGAASDVDSQ
jgi:PST family polysaccharide transporter